MSSASDKDPSPVASDLDQALPGGMTSEGLIEAIVRSGYPLQTVVAAALKKRSFEIVEEWAYQDPEHQVRRSMDVLATRSISRSPYRTKRGMSSLDLTLVIECKRSEHPYVLFESVDPIEGDRFPVISGLEAGTVELAPEYQPQSTPHMRWHDAPFVLEVSLQSFLGLGEDEFVCAPPVVSSLSKAVPNNKKVKLSGEEPHNALSQPLAKATAIFRAELNHHRGHGNDTTEVHVVLPVAVLDAPMILVPKYGREVQPVPVSWARALIRRPLGEKPWWDSLDYDVIDIVHRDFFNSYLDKQLLPYMKRLWKLQTTCHEHCMSGRVFVRGLSETEVPGEDLLERLCDTA